MYAMMSSMTYEAYFAVTEYMLEHICKFEKVKVIMTDFEAAMRKAVTESFPNALAVGCNVHFDRVGLLFFSIHK